jgi:glycerol-3-phosphate dehydrogenase
MGFAMPLIQEISAKQYFQNETITGRVFIFEESFAGAQTGFQSQGLAAAQISTLEANVADLYIISVSSAVNANCTFKNGIAAASGFRIELTENGRSYIGENARALILSPGIGQDKRLAIDVSAAMFMQYAVAVKF